MPGLELAEPREALRSSASRGAVLLAAALVLAALHLPWRPRTVCLLRTVCGVPCPACGGTTSAVDVGHGHLFAAFKASPLAFLGAIAFVGLPFVRVPHLTAVQRWTLIVAIAVTAELWQLGRFGFL